MDNLGPILREARTKSGKTFEEAVKETKIAKKYLVALENEDFDIFPGETYLLGFLRNYAQFLGLDPDEMVIKYRDYKIQEQPAPIEQLTARAKSPKRYLAFLVIFVLLFSITISVLVIGRKEKKSIAEGKKPVETSAVKSSGEKVEKVILLDEEETIRDFNKGDILEIPQRDKSYRLSIDGINENLKFSIGDVPFSLSTNERVEIDFDRDGRKDILIRTNRLGEGKVNLTFKRLYDTKASDSEALPEKGTGKERQVELKGPPDVVVIKEEDILAKVPVAPKSGFQVVSSYEKTNITLHVKAKKTAYFGYIIDEGEKKEALLRNGDELSFTAKDVLNIMVANASAVELDINRIPVTLGKGGETVAKVVRWYRDSEGSDLYQLIFDDWER